MAAKVFEVNNVLPATSGDYYYNTTDKKIYKYDTSWSEWLGE